MTGTRCTAAKGKDQAEVVIEARSHMVNFNRSYSNCFKTASHFLQFHRGHVNIQTGLRNALVLI